MRKLGMAILLGLSGCTAPVPVISDLESDKVLVQYNGQDSGMLIAEAQRGCAIHGKTAQGPISRRCWNVGAYGSCYGWEYLFACGPTAQTQAIPSHQSEGDRTLVRCRVPDGTSIFTTESGCSQLSGKPAG